MIPLEIFIFGNLVGSMLWSHHMSDRAETRGIRAGWKFFVISQASWWGGAWFARGIAWAVLS